MALGAVPGAAGTATAHVPASAEPCPILQNVPCWALALVCNISNTNLTCDLLWPFIGPPDAGSCGNHGGCHCPQPDGSPCSDAATQTLHLPGAVSIPAPPPIPVPAWPDPSPLLGLLDAVGTGGGCNNYGVITMITVTGTNYYCEDSPCTNQGIIIFVGRTFSCEGGGLAGVCVGETCQFVPGPQSSKTDLIS